MSETQTRGMNVGAPGASLAVALSLLASGCGLDLRSGSDFVVDRSNESLPVLADGPLQVAEGSYDLTTGEDPRVLSNYVTDARAQVYAPQGGGPFPLAIFLHGNHSTCGTPVPGGPRQDHGNDFTFTGQCPPPQVEAPSHLGYAHIARHLASHGYVVVSINANRGITANTREDVLTTERGRLVLKHLALLQQLNRGELSAPGLDLTGQIDFEHVGMMGHSRGGQGVRAAVGLLQTYQQRCTAPDSYAAEASPVRIEGVIELAPTDFYRQDDAPGVDWTVVVAGCDGDVSDYQGADVFRRRRQGSAAGSFSSVVVVPGANHNYFNTEWQQSDSPGCPPGQVPLWDPTNPDTMGSLTQQELGRGLVSAYFRGFVGNATNRTAYRRVFDPHYAPPTELTSMIPPAREAFDGPSTTMVALSSYQSGGPGLQVTPVQARERELLAAYWTQPGGHVDLLLGDEGRDLSSTSRIGLSLGRFDDEPCGQGGSCAPLDFTLQLLYGDDTVSAPVPLTDYASVVGNINCDPRTPRCNWQAAELLFQTVPLDLADFGDPSRLRSVRGLRLNIDRTPRAGFVLDQRVSLQR
jgi:dienelactone hydrolase